MRKQSSKAILMKDGSARRVPGDVAEQLIDSGQAKHYISNTVFRALNFGIDVPDPKTRDEKGVLMTKIRAAREKAVKRRKKDDDKREKEERDLLEEDAA